MKFQIKSFLNNNMIQWDQQHLYLILCHQKSQSLLEKTVNHSQQLKNKNTNKEQFYLTCQLQHPAEPLKDKEWILF